MKEYYLEEIKEIDKYQKFMKHMLLCSDAFSVVYFRYKENEKIKNSVKKIAKELKQFKLDSKNVDKWPNTETKDNSHIYKFVLYRADEKCLDTMLSVNGLFEWDYPYAPMDLCFYKNGYCWFALTAHEHMAFLYTNNMDEVEAIKELGINLIYEGETEVFSIDMI